MDGISNIVHNYVKASRSGDWALMRHLEKAGRSIVEYSDWIKLCREEAAMYDRPPSPR
jgi:hypothetical protein